MPSWSVSASDTRRNRTGSAAHGRSRRREADRIALPYRHAFDEIGDGWRHAVTGLVEGTLSFRGAALEVAQSVERGFIRMLQTTASRAAAGPLASLLGQPAPAAGEGVGDVLGNAVGSWLFGAPQQLGAAARRQRIPPRSPPIPRRLGH